MKNNKNILLTTCMLYILTTQTYCSKKDVQENNLNWSLVHHYQNHFNNDKDDINFQHPTTKETALHQAIRQYKYHDALKLLKFPGINPKLLDYSGTTVKELVIQEAEFINDPTLQEIQDKIETLDRKKHK